MHSFLCCEFPLESAAACKTAYRFSVSITSISSLLQKCYAAAISLFFFWELACCSWAELGTPFPKAGRWIAQALNKFKQQVMLACLGNECSHFSYALFVAPSIYTKSVAWARIGLLWWSPAWLKSDTRINVCPHLAWSLRILKENKI